MNYNQMNECWDVIEDIPSTEKRFRRVSKEFVADVLNSRSGTPQRGLFIHSNVFLSKTPAALINETIKKFDSN